MSQSTRHPLFWVLGLGVIILLMGNLAYAQNATTVTVTEYNITSTTTIYQTVTTTVEPAEAEDVLLISALSWVYDRILDLAELIIISPESPWVLVVIFAGLSITLFLMYLKVR